MIWWLCLCPPNTRTHLLGLFGFIFFSWGLLFFFFFLFLSVFIFLFFWVKADLSKCPDIVYNYALRFRLLFNNNCIINCFMMVFSLWVDSLKQSRLDKDNGGYVGFDTVGPICVMMPRYHQVLNPPHINFLICSYCTNIVFFFPSNFVFNEDLQLTLAVIAHFVQ